MAVPTRARANAHIVVDKSDVDRLIAGIEHATSPPALQAFLLARASRWLQARTLNNFATESKPGGGTAWAPLRDATNDIRENLGYPPEHPINERSGEMKEWLAHSWGDAAMTAHGAALLWPSAAPSELAERKLKVAQQGSRRGENPLFPNSATVPRPVMGIDEVDLAAILSLLGEHLHQMLGGTATVGGIFG